VHFSILNDKVKKVIEVSKETIKLLLQTEVNIKSKGVELFLKKRSILKKDSGILWER